MKSRTQSKKLNTPSSTVKSRLKGRRQAKIDAKAMRGIKKERKPDISWTP